MKTTPVLLVASLILIGAATTPVMAQTASVPPAAMAQAPAGTVRHQPGNDHRRQIEVGMRKIEAAHDHLSRAGDDWGGHRVAAIHDLEAAHHELEAAMEFENQRMSHP